MKTIYVTIYSDGSVKSLDEDNINIPELTGGLETLHDIINIYNHNKVVNKKPRNPYPFDFTQIDVYFCISGDNNRLKFPHKHLERFVKRIKESSFCFDDVEKIIEEELSKSES